MNKCTGLINFIVNTDAKRKYIINERESVNYIVITPHLAALWYILPFLKKCSIEIIFSMLNLGVVKWL